MLGKNQEPLPVLANRLARKSFEEGVFFILGRFGQTYNEATLEFESEFSDHATCGSNRDAHAFRTINSSTGH